MLANDINTRPTLTPYKSPCAPSVPCLQCGAPVACGERTPLEGDWRYFAQCAQCGDGMELYQWYPVRGLRSFCSVFFFAFPPPPLQLMVVGGKQVTHEDDLLLISMYNLRNLPHVSLFEVARFVFDNWTRLTDTPIPEDERGRHFVTEYLQRAVDRNLGGFLVSSRAPSKNGVLTFELNADIVWPKKGTLDFPRTFSTWQSLGDGASSSSS